MPKVSEFFGITIYFYYRDHEPPHFHARYAEHEALIAIESLEVLRGRLPPGRRTLWWNGLLPIAPNFGGRGNLRD